jgi:hypothetical protein
MVTGPDRPDAEMRSAGSVSIGAAHAELPLGRGGTGLIDDQRPARSPAVHRGVVPEDLPSELLRITSSEPDTWPNAKDNQHGTLGLGDMAPRTSKRVKRCAADQHSSSARRRCYLDTPLPVLPLQLPDDVT